MESNISIITIQSCHICHHYIHLFVLGWLIKIVKGRKPNQTKPSCRQLSIGVRLNFCLKLVWKASISVKVTIIFWLNIFCQQVVDTSVWVLFFMDPPRSLQVIKDSGKKNRNEYFFAFFPIQKNSVAVQYPNFHVDIGLNCYKSFFRHASVSRT